MRSTIYIAITLFSIQSAHAQLTFGDFLGVIVREGIESTVEPEQPRRSPPPLNEQQVASSYDGLSRRQLMTLQQGLANLGYYSGSIDGIFGRRSRAAAADYQRALGDNPSGYLSSSQINLLIDQGSTPPSSPSPSVPNVDDVPLPLIALGTTESTTDAAIEPGMAGMPTRNGAVLLAPTSNAALTEALAGDYREYNRMLYRFGKLLILAGNPSLLERPESTGFFVSLVNFDRAAPFLNPALNGSGLDYVSPGEWRGDNQFAREDSRLAFLSAFKEELLSLAPTLPLRIDILRPIAYGNYADGSLGIEIDRHDVFPYYSAVGLSAPEPFSLPQTWDLNADEARRVVELVPTGDYDRPVVVTRSVITGARPTDVGVILDVAAIDMQVYSSKALDEVVGAIPLPENAVTAEGEAQPNEGTQVGELTGVPLNPMLIRMLIASEEPEFADTESFRSETFRVLRAAERQLREETRVPPIGWPLLIAPSLINSNAEPEESDLAEVTDWFTATMQTDIANATLTGLCSFESRTSDECRFYGGALQGDGSLVLRDAVKNALQKWDYGWHGLPRDSHEMAQQAYPGNAGSIAFGAGRDVPGLLILKAHPAWYSLRMPEGTYSDAVLDVAIIGHQILGTPSGKGVVAIEIEPRAFRYLKGGVWNALAIEAAPVATAEYQLDVLGVKLGMPLEEAQSIIALSFDGRRFSQAEMAYNVGNDPVFGENDPILGTAVNFRSPPYEYDNFPDDEGNEAIKLYYNALLPDKPVIAISRVVKFAEGVTSNAEENAAGQPVLDGMIEKYGQPDLTGRLFGNGPTIWAVDATAKARIAAEDETCELDYVLGSADTNSGRFRSGLISNPCGELLSAWFGNGRVNLFLTDTDAILKLREHYVGVLSEAKAEAAASKPVIQF